jgi:hypothetical protein
MPRKVSTKPTRIWSFAARLSDPGDIARAREILFRSNRYYNVLVEIEQARHARFVEIRRRHAPELAVLEDRWTALDEQISALYREAKNDRKAHWQETADYPKRDGEKKRLLPPEYQARKDVFEAEQKAASAAAKPLRAAFSALLKPAQEEFKRRAAERAPGGAPQTKHRVNAEVLAEMLAEPAWHPVWREIAASDDLAHAAHLRARAVNRLYCGTYLGVEEAFQRAKKDSLPRPPRFHRFDGEGKIQMQPKKGTTWGMLKAGRLTMTELPRRPGVSRRTNMYRVVFDQERDDEAMTVTATARLHRIPPHGAEVKWVSLLIRRIGQRAQCSLQFTLEDHSFSEPKRPAGTRAPAHLALGWAKTDGGIRVARYGDEEVVMPAAILDQYEYASAVERIADRLRNGVVRRLQLLAYRAGQRHPAFVWRQMASGGRYTEFLRARCEEYARHVFGAQPLRDKWQAWVQSRKAEGLDLYAPFAALRQGIAMPDGSRRFWNRTRREDFAWWLYLWARKDAHLDQLAIDSRRRAIHRRDAHYRREAIRIATEFESVTVDDFKIDELKKLDPLTMPGEGIRDLAQHQLQAAAPGRFRELLLEVMGPRCTPCARSVDKKPKAATVKKLDKPKVDKKPKAGKKPKNVDPQSNAAE